MAPMPVMMLLLEVSSPRSVELLVTTCGCILLLCVISPGELGPLLVSRTTVMLARFRKARCVAALAAIGALLMMWTCVTIRCVLLGVRTSWCMLLIRTLPNRMVLLIDRLAIVLRNMMLHLLYLWLSRYPLTYSMNSTVRTSIVNAKVLTRMQSVWALTRALGGLGLGWGWRARWGWCWLLGVLVWFGVWCRGCVV